MPREHETNVRDAVHIVTGWSRVSAKGRLRTRPAESESPGNLLL